MSPGDLGDEAVAGGSDAVEKRQRLTDNPNLKIDRSTQTSRSRAHVRSTGTARTRVSGRTSSAPRTWLGTSAIMTTYELEIDDRLVGLHAHLAALRLQQEQLGHSFYALLGDAPAAPLAGVPEDAQGDAPQGEERVLYGRPRSIGAEKAAQAVRSVAGLVAGPVLSGGRPTLARQRS
ncbi:hypothetical protein T492DRAFT_1138403 [Pavlovales sp. CCMP2436]|nr:hypothetical protein T492DRAFT_1138403 [Pavlovales sp. CCMP2436]